MRDLILEYLQKYGSITSWDAIQEFGCTRLSEYIRQLRKDYIIISENIPTITRTGRKTTYAKYILKND